jgi:hypothetical protein
MVLTAAQTTAFFENAAQMAISNATVIELVNEGINTVDDLSEFDKDTIGKIAYNLFVDLQQSLRTISAPSLSKG